MNSRDDYPILADTAKRDDLLCSTEAAQALDELDVLRPIVIAAAKWRQARYAQHGNTAEASRAHYVELADREFDLTEALESLVDYALDMGIRR